MAIKSKLGQLDKNWGDVKEEFGDSTGGFSTVPSGNYVLHKVTAKLDESASSGKLMVKRSAEVKEGDYEGETIYDNLNIETDRGPEFLLKWLNLMGYQVDSLKDDLESALEAITNNPDATYQCSVKEADGYNNIYFNKCIDEGDPDGSGDEGGSDDPGDGGDGIELPDLDELTRRQLKKLIKENSLKVDADEHEDDDDLRDAIETAAKEAKPKKEPKSSGRSASRRSASKSGDSEILKKLTSLSEAFGIQFEEGCSLSELKKTLKEYTFKPKDLEDEEAQALKDAGLGSIIK